MRNKARSTSTRPTQRREHWKRHKEKSAQADQQATLQRIERLDKGQQGQKKHRGCQWSSLAEGSPCCRDDEQRTEGGRPYQQKRVMRNADAGPARNQAPNEAQCHQPDSETDERASRRPAHDCDDERQGRYQERSTETQTAPHGYQCPHCNSPAQGRNGKPVVNARPGQRTPAADNLRRSHPQFSRKQTTGAKTGTRRRRYIVAVVGTGTGSPVTPSFFDSMRVLWRRKLLIILVLLVAVGATLGIDKSRTKQYQSTATLYFLAQGVTGGSGASTALSPQQLATDVELVQSTPVQNAVTKTLGVPSPPVSVSLVGTTQIADLTVQSTDPELAAKAANA